jgi:hypothetical protein
MSTTPVPIEPGDRVEHAGRTYRVITVDPPEVGTALVQLMTGPLRGTRVYLPVSRLARVD